LGLEKGFIRCKALFDLVLLIRGSG
jgi:hypothetical protein